MGFLLFILLLLIFYFKKHIMRLFYVKIWVVLISQYFKLIYYLTYNTLKK